MRIYVPAAIVLSILLHLWQGDAYVNYAEGVYLFSAQLVADGATPYRDFVAAHPPLLYYLGALTVGEPRLLLALAPLMTGAFVAIAVRRLTGAQAPSVAAGLVTLVTPWMLHEHATLMPESLGAPLIMGAALLAARERTAIAGGLVAGTAIGIKWPFLLPGALLAGAAVARVRFLIAFLVTFGVGVALSFARFGDGLDDQLVGAQQEIGWHSLHTVAGLLAQAAWNLGPLVVLAGLGLVLRGRTEDRGQLRALIAVAAGALLLVLTVTKTGTAVNVTQLAEPPLVALGAAGLVWAARTRWLVLAGAATALTATQSAAFALDPADPGLFVRPFSDPAYAWPASDAEADRIVDAARNCPSGVAYSGEPYYAFLAGRRMPGDEPDGFLLSFTEVGQERAPAVETDQPRCP